MADAKINWRDIHNQIYRVLDIAAEFEALGVHLANGRTPNAKGWIECHAINCEDRSPSAGICVSDGEYPGRYKDFRDSSRSCFLLEFARRHKNTTFGEVLKHHAGKAKVKLPSAEYEWPGDRLDFRTPSPEPTFFELKMYAEGKAGVTVRAIKEVGAKAASMPKTLPPEKRNNVFAFPMYGSSALIELDPTGWHCVASNPEMRIRKFCGKGNPEELIKTQTFDGYGLMNVDGLKRLAEATVVNLVEGITDLLTGQAVLGPWRDEDPDNRKHVVLSAGSCSNYIKPEWLQHFAGKEVRIWFDVGDPKNEGQNAAAVNVARLVPVAKAVRNVVLPLGKNGGKNDLRAWLTEPGANRGYAEMDQYAEVCRPLTEATDELQALSQDGRTYLPCVTLPGEDVTITASAETLGALMAKTGKFYLRGGLPVRASAVDGEIKLELLRPAAACSDFESVARLFKMKDKKEGLSKYFSICSETIARQIIESQAFLSRLPRIAVLSRCPVLTERNGELVTITGFDARSGIWAMGRMPPDMAIDEAGSLLNTLIADFQFASPGDRSRALAAFITPALVFGGLLGGRAPHDAGEADHSQSGKDYRNKLTTAIYRNSPRAITQREHGVGSLQESFDAALVSGACFPCLDNLRGKIDIAGIESFMTESTYYARIPFSPPMEIDTTRTLLLLTTNKAELTKDKAYRASIVRIRKHDDNHQFQRFPEGDLLDHVQANQERYLGAVFAVIREWHRAGKPQLENAPHDFKPWARTLGWIVENILQAAPLLNDHREIQARMSSPAGNWLRDLALAVKAAGKLDQPLRAHQILEIVREHEVETPGISADMDIDDPAQFQKATQVIGRKMSQALKDDEAAVDGALRVKREIGHDDQGRERKLYRFLEREGQEKSAFPNAPQCAPDENPDFPNPPIDAQVCNAGAHPHDLESVAPIGDLGASGESLGGIESTRACNHCDPGAWRIDADKAYCPGCGRFMGNVEAAHA